MYRTITVTARVTLNLTSILNVDKTSQLMKCEQLAGDRGDPGGETEEQEEAGPQQIPGAQTERQFLLLRGGDEELCQQVLPLSKLPSSQTEERRATSQSGHHGQLLLL